MREDMTRMARQWEEFRNQAQELRGYRLPSPSLDRVSGSSSSSEEDRDPRRPRRPLERIEIARLLQTEEHQNPPDKRAQGRAEQVELEVVDPAAPHNREPSPPTSPSPSSPLPHKKT